MLTTLSNIQELLLIARNASFAFKGQARDIREIGRMIGARYVLEGSVRKAGNRVRLAAQLIDSQNGVSVAPRNRLKPASVATCRNCVRPLGLRAGFGVRYQSFAFSRASFSAMNARISSDMFRSFSHCSLYNVTGKRPIP